MTQFQEFTRWWVRIEPGLLRLASRYAHSFDSARELVQEVAVLALRNFSRLRAEEEFYRWTRARLHWLALDELRSSKRNRHLSLERIGPPVSQPTQEETVLLHELFALMEKLPPRQRRVLRSTLEGKPNEVIAKDLQITEATVRSLQRFARQGLITLLEEQGG